MMCLARKSTDAVEESLQDAGSSAAGSEAANTISKYISILAEKFETTKLYKYFYVTGGRLMIQAKRRLRRAEHFCQSHKPKFQLSEHHSRLLSLSLIHIFGLYDAGHRHECHGSHSQRHQPGG